MQKGRIDIITMGCSKNLVDSEQLMSRLEHLGYTLHHNSHEVCGEIVIVNTCGFIGDAKEESIEMILDLAEAKKEKQIGKLIVMGCLSERYLKELQGELPEVDAFYGKFDWENIALILAKEKGITSQCVPWARHVTTPPWSAYLKISEGCNRFCAYCAIPLITGRHHSRPIEQLLQEVRWLVNKGVKEFNVIAQDLSAYGTDFEDGKSHLAELIDRMADIKGVEWIRLHYAYPVDFPWDVLQVMKKRDNVCKYLDIALQHISDSVLENMHRHIDKENTIELINRIRAEVPEIKLRTTLMVGFPGEGENEFEELMQFTHDVKFERMGAFAYSEEEGTYAAIHFQDDINEDVKQKRLERLMSLQQEISYKTNQTMIGKHVKVLIENERNGMLVGRTQWDSPEVDPEVLIQYSDETRCIKPGDFVEVIITDATEYELSGKII